jgi:hypothetical protein
MEVPLASFKTGVLLVDVMGLWDMHVLQMDMQYDVQLYKMIQTSQKTKFKLYVM